MSIIIGTLILVSFSVLFSAIYRIKIFKQITTEMTEVGIDVNEVSFTICDISAF